MNNNDWTIIDSHPDFIAMERNNLRKSQDRIKQRLLEIDRLPRLAFKSFTILNEDDPHLRELFREGNPIISFTDPSDTFMQDHVHILMYQEQVHMIHTHLARGGNRFTVYR